MIRKKSTRKNLIAEQQLDSPREPFILHITLRGNHRHYGLKNGKLFEPTKKQDEKNRNKSIRHIRVRRRNIINSNKSFWKGIIKDHHFHAMVVNEARYLKENLTDEQLQKITFMKHNPVSKSKNIYGLVFGYSECEQAYFFYPKIFSRKVNEISNSFMHGVTPLEKYLILLHNEYESDVIREDYVIESLILYLQSKNIQSWMMDKRVKFRG